MPKISIIIPTYNNQKYIREALESALCQSLQDIEIIIADSASKDKTIEIINEYAKNDKRIKVLNLPGAYPGVARNAGIDAANGEYIMFLDSDDWLDEKACEKAYNHISKNDDDFAFFGMFDFFQKKDKLCKARYKLRHFREHFDGESFHLYEMEHPFVEGGECWYKIYKREFLNKNNIRFAPERFCEDVPFYAHAIACSDKVSVLNEFLYYFRRADGSSRSLYAKDYWLDAFTSREKAFEHIKNSKHADIYTRLFLPYYVNSICYWYGEWKSAKVPTINLYYKKMHKLFLELDKNYDLDEFKEYISRSNTFKNAKKYSYLQQKCVNLFKKVFSVRYEKKHKVTTIFGIKFKTRFSWICASYQKQKAVYNNILKRLQKEVASRKLRVAFYVSDSKWKTQSLYDSMLKSKYFSPFVIIGRNHVPDDHFEFQTQEETEQRYKFFADKNMECYMSYDFESKKYVPIDEFKPDIVFYSRPWHIPPEHSVKMTSDFLACHVPYYISNYPIENETDLNFYNYLWRFYVLNNELKEEYAQNLKNKGDNLRSVGHPCFDPYINWKKPNESELKYVIYAPHWTVGGDTELNYATFEWNGQYMLEFAKQHPEYTWVFKPHPALRGKLIDSQIMTKEEVDNYYNAWNSVGVCYEGPDYFKYFDKAWCMITDCGSFLAEFMPTQRPVILLHSGIALPYNFLARKVTQHYYKVKNIRELKDKLNKILLKNLDPWKERRLESLRNLKLVTNASENIIQDLKNELKIKN